LGCSREGFAVPPVIFKKFLAQTASPKGIPVCIIPKGFLGSVAQKSPFEARLGIALYIQKKALGILGALDKNIFGFMKLIKSQI
jgi:hypothetical protein